MQFAPQSSIDSVPYGNDQTLVAFQSSPSPSESLYLESRLDDASAVETTLRRTDVAGGAGDVPAKRSAVRDPLAATRSSRPSVGPIELALRAAFGAGVIAVCVFIWSRRTGARAPQPAPQPPVSPGAPASRSIPWESKNPSRSVARREEARKVQ